MEISELNEKSLFNKNDLVVSRDEIYKKTYSKVEELLTLINKAMEENYKKGESMES